MPMRAARTIIAIGSITALILAVAPAAQADSGLLPTPLPTGVVQVVVSAAGVEATATADLSSPSAQVDVHASVSATDGSGAADVDPPSVDADVSATGSIPTTPPGDAQQGSIEPGAPPVPVSAPTVVAAPAPALPDRTPASSSEPASPVGPPQRSGGGGSASVPPGDVLAGDGSSGGGKMGQDARAARTATTASSSPALRDTATGPAIHDEPVRALPGSSLGENVGLHSAVSTSLLLKIELCLAFVLFLAVVAALTWEVGSRPL